MGLLKGLAFVATAFTAALLPGSRAQGAPPTPSPHAAALDAAAKKLHDAADSMAATLAAPPPVLAAPAPQAMPPPPSAAAPPVYGSPPPPATGNTPAAQVTAVAEKPPPASLSGFLIGLDFETLGFIEKTDHVSPVPELEVGYGSDAFRFAGLFSTFIGNDVGYAFGVRLEGGTHAASVGYNLGVDLHGIGVNVPSPGLTGSGGKLEKGLLGEIGATLNPVDITIRAGSVLVELRLVSVGYFYVPNVNGQSFAIGGGLAATWFP